MLPEKLYNSIKYLTLIGLPAFGTLYLGLAQIWTNLPHPADVAATVTVICTFLGTLVGINSAARNRSFDGYLAVDGHNELTGHPNLKMVVTINPADLDKKKVVRLKLGEAPQVTTNMA